MAMLPGLIPTPLVRLLPTLLLGHLLTDFMWYILTLGVGDSGANFVRGCPAFGVRDLFAVLHWQFLALLPRHLLAHLVAAGTLTQTCRGTETQRCLGTC